MHAGTNAILAGPKGRYLERMNFDRQTYADAIANVNKTWGGFNLIANVGGSIKDTRVEMSETEGDLRDVTNFFSVENIVGSGYYKVDRDGMRRQTQSVFANVELGWKNYLFLSGTVRADWDSALAFSSYGKSLLSILSRSLRSFP